MSDYLLNFQLFLKNSQEKKHKYHASIRVRLELEQLMLKGIQSPLRGSRQLLEVKIRPQ